VTAEPAAGASRGPWSAADLATLAAIAETFVRGDGMSRARLASDALTEVGDPSQVSQLRLVLRVMESRLANVALTGQATGFSAMTPEARERYLLAWATSGIAQRRTAFQGLRKLLTFLAYADPGTSAPNPRLTSIGYETDDPPVTADLTPIRPTPIPDATSPGAPVVLDADVVVVGSGAGGGVVAAALAEAGRSVVVLEAGPFVDEATMPRDELDAFDRLYLDHGLVSSWDGSVTFLAGGTVGGGTTVNWMTSIPASETVRDGWVREHGLDGVTGRPWTSDVEAIEREIDVAPATHIPAKDGIILRGAQALDWEAAPTRRDATSCGDCGSCSFGCRRGTKQSGLRAHLARAAGAGARIVPDARVTRVLIEGSRATGVEAEVGGGGAGDGRRLDVRAKAVVLAAGALRTPAVLQRSGLTHPSIGRHLRIHPVPVIAGWFGETIDMWRGTMQGARSMEFGDPAGDGPAGRDRNGYVIESAPGHPGLLALALPWEGTDAHERVMRGVRHIAPLIAVTRDGGEGRTTLTRAGRVRIDYRLDETGVATMRHALVRMARLLRAAGAEEIIAVGTPPTWYRPGSASGGDPGPGLSDAAFAAFEASLETFDFRPNRGTVFSAHQMGSARMGAAPADHPVDPWSRVRVGPRGDEVIRGLYVADGSVFPTGIGVNPMVTIMALARRAARTVVSEL
jgi:choline dehydrogenase-like flavoprotein